RIAIWTRESSSEQPTADFDLSRGGPTERTRRVHFITPPRRVAVGIMYDERLRGDEDFRTIRFPPAPLGLGSMNQRSQLVGVNLTRGTDRVRLNYWTGNSNAHGTVFGLDDVVSSDTRRADLRWETTWRQAQVLLDVAHHSWDEPRVVAGQPASLRSARTLVALDAGGSSFGAWRLWLRARGTESSADGTPLTGGRLAARRRREDAELEVGRDDVVRWSLLAGAHHVDTAGVQYSASGAIERDSGAWTIAARGAHDVEYA